MPLIHLPAPYKDELLYSVLARAGTRLGLGSGAVKLMYLRRPSDDNVELNGNLRTLEAHACPALRLTADDWLWSHTVFPYYAAAAPESVADGVATVYKGCDLRRGLGTKLGLAGRVMVQNPRVLRFCPSCHEEDMARLGESYWRCSHHIPGVIACSKHATLLVDSGLIIGIVHRPQLIDASFVDPQAARATAPLSNHELTIAHEVSVRCSRILNRSANNGDFGSSRLRELARSRKLTGKNWGFDLRRISSIVLSCFGQELLDRAGVRTTMSHKGILNWVSMSFASRPASIQPMILKVMIEMALTSLPEPGVQCLTPETRPKRERKPILTASAGEIQERRAKWVAKVEKAAAPNITNALRQNGKLALYLRTHDRSWYDSFNSEHRRVASKVARTVADAEVALGKLRVADLWLRTKPNVRRSKNILSRIAGLTKTTRSLQEIRLFLEEHSESSLQYRFRKIRQAKVQLEAGEHRRNLTTLERLSGISTTRLKSPELEIAVKDFLEEAQDRGMAGAQNKP